tara:strand:+ start:357 stop:881 length:525 start_codon:yes stop_codon:yes gene_type:complete
MQDIYDIVKNIEGIYDSNTSFQVLKDFERVLDELDIYVYANWQDGELAEGPIIERHWVTCSFMWDRNKMPDPMGGQRLLDYDCKVFMGKDYVVKPRKIRKPEDVRSDSNKGKLDRHAIWIVKIQMPKKLIADIYGGYNKVEELDNITAQETPQAADQTVDQPAVAAPEAAGEAV